MRPGRSAGMISPIGAVNLRCRLAQKPGVNMVWNMAKPKVQPVSSARISTISILFLFENVGRLQEQGLAFGGQRMGPRGKAAAAASTARLASARFPAGTRAKTSPV